MVGDKGYSSTHIRQYLRKRGIGVVIPRRSNERRRGRFDKTAYRQRNVAERLVNRLKQFRRIATRYEKTPRNFLAVVHLACAMVWLRSLLQNRVLSRWTGCRGSFDERAEP